LEIIDYFILSDTSVYKQVEKLINFISKNKKIALQTTIKTNSHMFNKIYNERVDMCLVQLLSVIWRKIKLNPGFLHLFVVSSIRDDWSTELSGLPNYSQIDILDAVMSLINHPQAGIKAKEIILFAIHLKDINIDNYLYNNTTFIPTLMTEISKHFSSCMSTFLFHTNSLSYNPNNKDTDKFCGINNEKNHVFRSPEMSSNHNYSNTSQYSTSPVKSLNAPSISEQKNGQTSFPKWTNFDANTHQLNIGKCISVSFSQLIFVL
jgi:hypothetical protein